MLSEGLAADIDPGEPRRAEGRLPRDPLVQPVHRGHHGRRARSGDSVVRIRAWVNAYGEERASIRAETAMRSLANPSLPPRELDQQAPPDNPAAVRVARVLQTLARRYPVPGATPPEPPAAAATRKEDAKRHRRHAAVPADRQAAPGADAAHPAHADAQSLATRAAKHRRGAQACAPSSCPPARLPRCPAAPPTSRTSGPTSPAVQDPARRPCRGRRAASW